MAIIRGHEAQQEGYNFHSQDSDKFPSLITVFSAPNYCDTYRNKGAIIKVWLFLKIYNCRVTKVISKYDGAQIEIKQFPWVPHPYWLPGFKNGIEWSLPFVFEKVGISSANIVFNLTIYLYQVFDILQAVLNLCPDDELADSDDSDIDSDIDLEDDLNITTQKDPLMIKIKAISEIANYYRAQRQHNEKGINLLKYNRLATGQLV